MKAKRIYLAEDHRFVAESLAALLELSSFEVTIFANGKELINACNSEVPNLALLDISMPVMDGITTLKTLREHLPDLKIIMLTMQDERSIILECLQEGAQGYLNKNCSTDELTEAVEKVINGELYLSEEVAEIIKNHHKNDNSELDLLTKQEKKIVGLLCKGQSRNEIAETLHISPRTVESHINNALQKLDLHSSTQLVLAMAKYQLS